MEDGKRFVKTNIACKTLNISRATLLQWERDNIIEVIRPRKTGARLYNINMLAKNNIDVGNDKTNKNFCYCRVSSHKQQDDLQRQIEFMQNRFPDYEIIKDIGSGINWSRSGLKKLLKKSKKGNLEHLVVAHRDRLCRFSFELLEYIFKLNGTKIIVLDSQKQHSEHASSEELAEDLLSIVHVFNCREMGKRRYRKKEKKDNKIVEG